MPIELWWPTPIYFSGFDGDVKFYNVIKNEINKSIAGQKINDPWDCDMGASFSYGEDNSFLDDTPIFKNYLESHIKKFINRDDFYIFESWVNIYKKGSYQEYHNHQSTKVMPIISGCYYHKTSGKDGDIIFRCDSTGLKNSSILDYEDIRYSPEEGKILLFPSFLEHCVRHNKTDSERISIAFNACLKQG